ncbi:hypothetical protein CT3_24620 [Comamonas terrigena NBRC 13299]|nr:hypothetical protein CT3_24620 [Comamonas terrigena NBRC 13299]
MQCRVGQGGAASAWHGAGMERRGRCHGALCMCAPVGQTTGAVEVAGPHAAAQAMGKRRAAVLV